MRRNNGEGVPPRVPQAFSCRTVDEIVAANPDSPRLPIPGLLAGNSLAVTNARIYTDPDSPPIERGTVLVTGGRISEVGGDVRSPPGTPTLNAEGGSVTAGFWNAHVHFTERFWAGGGRASVPSVEARLAQMLTSRGFTSVVDTGSDPRSTLPLRDRVASGEVRGPTIYSSGTGLYPPQGIPYYLKGQLPFYAHWFIPQPSDPRAAVRAVERSVARGVDLVKLFTGSYVARGQIRPMPGPIATAAVEAAHRAGRLVFSHPSNFEGTQVALDSQVDVLAHAPDSTEGVDDALLHRLISNGIAMVPTLKMFGTTVTSNPGYLHPIYSIVRRFHELGGVLIFGTDVGYMRDYTTDGEFEALAKSGISSREVLRMLTTAPARRFGLSEVMGSVTPGRLGDLVVLNGDPGADPRAFSQVRFTIRQGRVIWST